MKLKLVGSLVLSLVLALVFSSFVLADDMNMNNGTSKKVDGINAKLSFNDSKVKTGKNDIMITLSDNSNMPISDATVSATAEMDKNMDMNMKDSQPLTINFNKGDDQGQYMGTVNFTDKGKWMVKATIKDQGQEKNVEFDVDVAGSGPNWGIIGGFVVLIALILVVALIKKKKTVKA